MSGEKLLGTEQQAINPELEAKKTLTSALKSQIESYSLADSVNKFLQKQISQIEKNYHMDNFDGKISLIQKSTENLAELHKITSGALGFEALGSMILTLDDLSKNSIIYMFAESDFGKLTKYFKVNGIPTNKTMLDEFGKKFELELNFISKQERERKLTVNVENASIETLTAIYDATSDRLDPASEVTAMLKQIAETGDRSIFEKLIPYLKSNPEELKKLATTLQEIDKEKGTRYYENLKHTLITADPIFLGILDELAAASSQKESERKLTFKEAYISSLSGDNPLLKGHMLESINRHGDTISIDLSKKPPLRELKLAGSEYALETETSIGILHKPEVQFTQELSKLDKQLVTINALQNKSIIDHVFDLSEHGYNLSEIKHQFKNVYHLDISFIDTLDELKSPVNLESKQKEIEAKIKTVEAKYTNALQEAMKLHRIETLENDEKTREILQFISNTGFDLIPKQYTDQLIAEVKSGMIIINQFKLDPARLDLKNGQFGESPTEADGIQWKKKLVQFFNILMSGETEKPLSVEAHISSSGKTEDKTKMKHMLISSGLITEGGNFNIEKARENLSKEVI